VAEQGTHAELMAAGGVYAGLYQIQFGGEQPDKAAPPATS
jgi:hypothetical protein